MTRRERAKWLPWVVGVLAFIGIGSVPISAQVYRFLTADDFRLNAALQIAKDDRRDKPKWAKICANPDILQAARQLGTTELPKLVDFWLKLRNAAEQRADWYYVALIAALAALMSGYEKLRQEPVVFCILLGVLGLGGVFAGFWIGHASLYDVGRINLIGQILECSPASAGFGVKNGQYLMDRGFAEGPFSAGIVFACLMVAAFAYRLSEPPEIGESHVHLHGGVSHE